MTDFSFLSIDPATRRVSLDARVPAFFSDPNRAYAALHAASDSGTVPYRDWPAAVKGHFVTRHPPLPTDRAPDG